MQVEDEGRFPSGQDRLADGPDPRRPVGQHHHLLGREHAVPVRELLQAGGELRGPAGPVRRPRAVDADADRTAGLVLQRLPGLRGPGCRPRGRRRPSPRGSSPRRPPACRPRPRPRGRAIGTPVPSIPSRTRFAGGDASASARSNACISSPSLTTWRWRVDAGTSTPAKFLSLRRACS